MGVTCSLVITSCDANNVLVHLRKGEPFMDLRLVGINQPIGLDRPILRMQYKNILICTDQELILNGALMVRRSQIKR